MRTESLALTLQKIFRTLNFNSGLLAIKNKQLSTPLGDFYPKLIKVISNLPTEPVSFQPLTVLIKLLNSKKAVVRLNHIGFCYKTHSQFQEKNNLIALAQKTGFHLYQEPSNDDGLWLFFGDAKKLNQPMIEILPVEKVTRWKKWRHYWLPHIHLDLDLKFPAKEILRLINKSYGKNFEPHLVIIDGTTYIVRCRLGIIDGVNLFLDLATNARKAENQRKNIWQKLV